MIYTYNTHTLKGHNSDHQFSDTRPHDLSAHQGHIWGIGQEGCHCVGKVGFGLIDRLNLVYK